MEMSTIGIGQSATGGGTQEGYHDELAIDLLEAAVQAEQKIKEAEQAGKKEVGRNMDPPQDVATPVASGSVVATTIVDETPEVSGDDGILQSGKPPADSAERDAHERAVAPERTGQAPAVPGILQPVEEQLSATVAFQSEAGTDRPELFQSPPPQTGFNVVRSDQAWARPSHEGYKGASIFVDGHALRKGESISSGVLGPLGFDKMCVGCGSVFKTCSTLWGYPFCCDCKGLCSTSAQARKLWRTQAAFVSPLEEGSCFGRVERAGVQESDPWVIVRKVAQDFHVVPATTFAVKMNVWIRVLCVASFYDRVCIEVESVNSEERCTVVLDDWFQHHWIPDVGDVLWISGLTTWGVLRDRVIQWLYPPTAGIGIAKQPKPAGTWKPSRALELFAGIGGWGEACENVLGVCEHFSIDIDPKPCALLALKRRLAPCSVDQLVEECVRDLSMVVVGDVADPRWWITTCVADPFDVLAWSSPCVTFSKAGLRAGLFSPEGTVLLKALGLRFVMGVPFSFGENVVGLSNHDHWPCIVDFAKKFGGFEWLALNLNSICPMQRPRLFIVQSDPGFQVSPQDVKSFAAKVSQDLRVPPSLIDAAEATLLRVTREVLRFLADPAMMVGQRVVTKDAREAFGYGVAERTYQWPGDEVPVLMANHGRQHLLPRKLLHQNGLMAWVLSDKRLGEGVASLRTMHPFEALWLLGFDVFGPISAKVEDQLKPIGNTVSPWIAGIFLAAVGALAGEPRFLVKMRKWLQWSAHKDRLTGLRVFTRGECQWLGAACPPTRPKGNSPWLLNWGHSFFLVSAELDCIDTEFVQALCGYGPEWQCKTIITPADPAQFHLPLVTVVGDVAVVTVQLCGVFRVDPGDTIGSIYLRAALSPKLHSLSIDSSHPALNTPVWAAVEKGLTGSLSLQGPAPVQPKGIRLIFRDDVHDILGQVGMSFATAIRVALPFPCHSEGAEIWDVVNEKEVLAQEVLPVQGGIFQVSLAPELFQIEPVGLIRLPPMSTVGECLILLNDALYGSKATMLMTGNGCTIAQEIAIGAAATRGVLRLKVYGLRGGGKPTVSPLDLSNKLQDLLIEKGVPKSAAEERTHEVYKGLGTKTLKQVFANRDPWQALKQEATKEKIVLIGAIERQQKENAAASSVKQVEEPFDAWQAWLDNRNQLKQAKARRRDAVEEASFQLDSSFFRDSHGGKLPIATPEELLGGAAGIAVCQESEVASLLPSFCSKNVTVDASAVVIIGGEASALGPRFRDLIVPGWMNGKTVALKVAVLSTGDEPLQWDEAQKVTVDVVNGNTVCLCFVYPAEAGDKWVMLEQGFDRYFKKIYPTAPEALVDHWAQAYYCKKRKVEPDHAEYYHVIVRINDKFLESVLKGCGRNGLYLQPRSPTRGLDTRFGVVRLTGLTREESLAMQQQVPFQLGLVRTTKVTSQKRKSPGSP